MVRLDLGAGAFDYTAGQAVRVRPLNGTSGRVYSIASHPDLASQQHLIELLVGVDGQAPAIGQFAPGRIVMLDGPLGAFTFPIRPTETEFVFVGGGTGVAPLRAMILEAVRIPNAAVALLYSARTRDAFAFEKELRGLTVSHRFQFKQTVTRDCDAGHWHGSVGRFGAQDLQPFIDSRSTLWFLCGPAGLVRDIRACLRNSGVPSARIRTERAASGFSRRACGLGPACGSVVETAAIGG